MNPKWQQLLRPYQSALQRYLRPGRQSLRPAVNLGRRATALGLDTLDLAIMHEQTLLEMVKRKGPVSVRLLDQTRTFFAAANQPLEETHRVAREAVIDLGRLNQALSRRTQELARSNQGLKQEVDRRLSIEKALRHSEKQSNQLLRQSRNLQDQLRSLSRQILSVQEEERRRISRELHDVIAQVLTGINFRLATLRIEARTNVQGINRNIERTQRMVTKSVEIVHRFARELRPTALDDLGLIPTLHSFAKEYSKKTGISVRLTAFAGVEQLSTIKRTVLYRVAQESLTNVARHARASRVDLAIHQQPNAVCLQVKDDGCAFVPQRVMDSRKGKRLGLLGMRERVEMVGGTFSVESAVGRGTTVHATIPFTPIRKKVGTR